LIANRKPAGKATVSEQGVESGEKYRDMKGVSSGQAASGSKLSQTLRALKHKNYQLFFGGQLISLSGTWMQSVAQSWLVYKLTGSAVMLGFVGFSGQIPVFLRPSAALSPTDISAITSSSLLRQ
jgi:hypothetical protein